MKTWPFVVGGIVLVGIWIGSSMQEAAKPDIPRLRVSHSGRDASHVISDPCATADEREREASDYIGKEEYQKTYDTAVSGLHYVDQCDNDTDNLLNKAYLLSFKAMAEHHLSSGDSRTDMNQANALLVECQTTPGFYGTHVGAQCETQEDYNIKAVTNWDMSE